MSATLASLPDWTQSLLMFVGAFCIGVTALAFAAWVLEKALTLAERALALAGAAARRFLEWLLTLLLMIAIAPFYLLGIALRALARWLWAMLRAQAVAGAKRLQRRLELRRIWKAEFREDFEAFADFLHAFENSGQQRPTPPPRGDERREPRFDPPPPPPPPKREPPRQPPPPPPDPRVLAFRAACTLLGLPEAGFTLAQLKERHRVLIHVQHPDRGGNTERAARINAARDLIKHQKGWTAS